MKFGIKMHKENSNRLGTMHKSVVRIFGNFWEFSISVPVFPLHKKGFFFRFEFIKWTRQMKRTLNEEQNELSPDVPDRMVVEK